MTVEPQNAHDPEDDDFYVLGDEDAETPASPSEVESKTPQRTGHGPGTLAAEEDVLFVPTEEQRHVGGETPFTVAKGSGWEQELATADAANESTDAAADAETADEDLSRYAQSGEFAIIESGSPSDTDDGEESEPSDADEEELELTDAAASTEQTAEAAEAAEAGEEGEAQEVAEEDDSWAPIEASGDPLLDGPGIGAEGQAEEGQEAQVAGTDAGDGADDAAVAAAAAAAVHGPTIVAGRGAGQPRRRGRSLAAAAALLVFGGGGYLAWQQGWLGAHEEQPTLVERAEIPRPKVSVTPEPPDLTKGPESKPGPVAGGHDPDPDPMPTPKGDPQPPPDPTPDPVAHDPVPPPVETTPKGGEPAPPGGATSPQLPDLARDLGTLQVGDGLTIRETPTEVQKERVSMNGIVPGSQAFAQLRNGNFFVGNVKAVDTDLVTLKLEKGEVTLAIVELKTIVPLASSEYKELKKVEQGFVRLNNRNRLLGTILASQDENIILENKANRVVIPKAEIEELGTVGKSTVRFADEDNSWVDRMIERQLSEHDAKEKEKEKSRISPAPLVEQKGKEAQKAKVKSVVDDDTGTRPK